MPDPAERLASALAERYTLERELGRGGMATVHLAQDRKHHRRVAIKVLKPELAQAIGTERFVREIEIAAKLTHPHILPLFDSGEADGLLYYVMPYVQGESLRDRLQREGRLPLDEAIRVTEQVAAALACAHEQGVIHRDVKPENILLAHGQAMVADFGVARAVEVAGGEHLTVTGIAIGTPEYMSPEQALGLAEVDSRTDVYALGCVVYEMLAGRAPFAGPTPQAVLAAQAVGSVPRLRKANAEVPLFVERAVERALARDPAERFSTVKGFAEALTAGTVVARVRRKHPWWRAVTEMASQRLSGVALGILTALLLVAGGGIALINEREPGAEATESSVAGGNLPVAVAAPAELASVAVLPFENMSPDPAQEFFADGLAEELLNVLAQIPGLRVVARTSSFAFKGQNVGADSIGRVLRVAHLIEGSVRRSNGRLRIQVQLIDAASGFRRWSQTYDRAAGDIFAVQDEISRAVAGQLRLNLAGDAPLTRRETADPEAHALALRALAVYREFSQEARLVSERLVRAAIARDSAYARPYALLATSLAWQAYFRQTPARAWLEARDAADRAIALDPHLPDAHEIRGVIANLYEWDFARADEHFRRALEISPGHPGARGSRAWLLMRLGRADQAIEEARLAVEADPLSAGRHNTLGLMYLYARRLDDAIEAFLTASALAPEYRAPLGNIALAYSLQGRHADAIASARRLHAVASDEQFTLTALARSHAWAGNRTEAESVLAVLRAQPEVSAYRLATVHAALGDQGRALELLERAVAERDDHASFLAVTPEFDALREHPRFDRLLRRAGLR
jgi:serine/threonine-protein kinase